MQLRWTEEAADDLERITDYLLAHTPERSARLLRRLYEAPVTLLTFPNRGRPGQKEGTRELVMSPLPCIVVYTVRDDLIYEVVEPIAKHGRREEARTVPSMTSAVTSRRSTSTHRSVPQRPGNARGVVPEVGIVPEGRGAQRRRPSA